ncbi:LacI family transcriptional regulator [Vibrio fortis]|uniref:LacI family transcriptional regulator n=1 Tax=Vibrio fortis TaxID=212667 RepID=A0A5N3SA02_9VIBR|nr:LacI family transcriptional regulator [Vibrio fortis]
MNNKKVTLDTLATLAGVSKATVSRVLNGNTYVSDDIKIKYSLQLLKLDTSRKAKA